MATGGAPGGAGPEVAAVNVPEIDRCIQTGLHEKTYSAAACIASVGGRVFHRAAYGSPRQVAAPTGRKPGLDLLFDLGSLTCPLGSGLLALWLVGKGRLDLGTTLRKTLPELADPRFDAVTLDMLLDHTAGLPASRPLVDELRRVDDRRPAAERVLGTRRATPELKKLAAAVPFAATPGTRAVESELGSLLLGWIVEGVVGAPLDAALEREVFGPLGVAADLFFVRHDDTRRAQQSSRRSFAAGEDCPWRKRLLQGEVSDPLAWAAGGVAGHAGLFGTVDAVWRVVEALRASHGGAGRDFLGGTVKRFWTRSRRVAATSRALAWDTTTANDSPAGRRFSQASVGHVSSTGGAVWIDLSTGVVGVFLANAQHPSPAGKAEALHTLQPRLFELIAKQGEALLPEVSSLGSRAFQGGPIPRR
jgi:CubicO group peptidase (beta-lactamase class C family)